MKILNLFKKISKIKTEIAGWISIVLFFSSLTGVFGLFEKIKNPLFIFLDKYYTELFILFILSALLFLYWEVKTIKSKLKVVFKEKLKNSLHENWDFTGDWKIEDGELSVTNSEAGGITKNGSFWENYVFEFETKMIKDFSGWIVRAKDIDNYFMFQINFDNIRPHLRLSQPILVKSEEDEKRFEVKEKRVAWQLFGNFPHHKTLKDRWFKVKTVVNGSRVDIFIDNDNVFHEDNFLTIPTGKVGFRESGQEHAHFRNIKVYSTG
ncbi:MAG: family 16 glycoside hydrolase [Patescibacteria group bacterium]